jgi:hypothetical protein
MYKLCLIFLLLFFIILLNINNTESYDNINNLNKNKIKTIDNDIKTTYNDIKLIGICVSYNYMDTLKYILPINHKHFEKIYIVTQKDDHKTIEFCNKFDNVEIVYFDFKEGGRKFNKGGGLKKAQKIAYREYPDHWYLMFDSDIVLPDNFKDILNRTNLNPDELYGCPRYIIKDINDIKNINNLDLFKEPFNAICVGFIQLYKRHKYYNDGYTAGRVDDQFKSLFNKNSLNLYVYHLGVPFKNWRGKIIDFNNLDCRQEDLIFRC